MSVCPPVYGSVCDCVCLCVPVSVFYPCLSLSLYLSLSVSVFVCIGQSKKVQNVLTKLDSPRAGNVIELSRSDRAMESGDPVGSDRGHGL